MSAILHGGWQDKVFVQLFSIVQKCGIPQKNLLRIQKLPIGEKEVGHSTKNVAIEHQKVTDSAKNVAIEKIPLLEILRLCDIKNYNQARRNSLRFHAACFYNRLRSFFAFIMQGNGPRRIHPLA